MADKQKKTKPLGDFAVNRKAWHDYEILQKLECGIVLTGTEVKAIRNGGVSLAGSYASVLSNELYAVEIHIPVYEFGNRFNHEPKRKRKLLVHQKEILSLKMKSEAKGCTLIPLRLYLKKGKIKLEIGVCRGKALHDKRETLKKKALKRDMERGF
ncbi:MAG: SsrA-binding protein SmpB [Kiritimatiellae bacterium]|nr:SsrA-binding protein SmpB [Kiritimatiellia bacterium]